jgi:hypothetical protein
MNYLITIALLWYLSERWPAFEVGLKVLMFFVGLTGFLIIARTGYPLLVLKALGRASADFVTGIFGLVKILLFD